MFRNIKLSFLWMPLVVVCVFMSCVSDREKKLIEAISDKMEIKEADYRALDTLFYQYDPFVYPYEEGYGNERSLKAKLEYIQKKNPYIKKNYYCDLLRKCQEVKPDRINIFLETSASMAGYYKNEIFQEAVMSLSLYGRDVTDCYLYSDVLKPKMSYADFALQFSRNEIVVGKSSLFNEMFRQIIGSTPANGASFFVTDGIIAAKEDDVKKFGTTPHGLDMVYNNLLQDIADQVRQSREKNPNFSISVYRFVCPFNGKYYNYLNEGKNDPNLLADRPFFIFALGDKKILEDFKRKVAAGNELKKFKPANQLHFMGKGIPNFVFKSECIVLEGDKNKVDVDALDDEKMLKIVVYLHDFPDYSNDEEYMQTHGVIRMNGVAIKPSEGQRNKGCFVLKLDNVQDVNVLNVELDLTNLPSWCGRYSTKNDRDIRECLDRSYYLEELLDALKEGMLPIRTVTNSYQFER